MSTIIILNDNNEKNNCLVFLSLFPKQQLINFTIHFLIANKTTRRRTGNGSFEETQ